MKNLYACVVLWLIRPALERRAAESPRASDHFGASSSELARTRYRIPPFGDVATDCKAGIELPNREIVADIRLGPDGAVSVAEAGLPEAVSAPPEGSR